jgi:hypothetical protein
VNASGTTRTGPTMAVDLSEWLAATAAQLVQARHDAVEEACEAALAGGVCGVLIAGDKVGPHPRVPYGTIYDITRVEDKSPWV